jgi:hypothetical protein
MGFFRYIAVPDDRELDIKEVGPQQAKCKKQFADIMEMGWLQTGGLTFFDPGDGRQDD